METKEKFYFEKPTIERKEDALEFANEFIEYNSQMHGFGGFHRYLDNYEGWLLKLEEDYVKIPDEEKVPAKTFFLVRESDKRIIGMINIRLVLNEKLKKRGGTIGYSIRPTERGKGYNKINLYLGLKVCNMHNIKDALLDADLDNPASWKTMEALGGIRIKEYFDDEESQTFTVDYSIDVEKSLKEHGEFEKYISSEWIK